MTLPEFLTSGIIKTGLIPGEAPTQKELMAKSMKEMQDFLDADVSKLAAGDKEAAKSLQMITLRGRTMIISKNASHRTTAVLMACLYGANNPGIDSVLFQVGAQGNFLTKEGDVRMEPFVSDAPEPDAKEAKEAKEAVPDGKRNILLEETPTLLFAALAPNGKTRLIGALTGKGTGDGGSLEFRTLEGKEVLVPSSYIVPINDHAHLKKLMDNLE